MYVGVFSDFRFWNRYLALRGIFISSKMCWYGSYGTRDSPFLRCKKDATVLWRDILQSRIEKLQRTKNKDKNDDRVCYVSEIVSVCIRPASQLEVITTWLLFLCGIEHRQTPLPNAAAFSTYVGAPILSVKPKPPSKSETRQLTQRSWSPLHEKSKGQVLERHHESS